MPHRRGAHGPTRQPSLAPTAPDATDRSAGLGRSCSVAQLEDTAAGVPLHRGHQPCSQCPDVGGLDLRVRSCRLLGGYLGHASLRALRSMRHIKPAAPPVRGTVQPPSRPPALEAPGAAKIEPPASTAGMAKAPPPWISKAQVARGPPAAPTRLLRVRDPKRAPCFDGVMLMALNRRTRGSEAGASLSGYAAIAENRHRRHRRHAHGQHGAVGVSQRPSHGRCPPVLQPGVLSPVPRSRLRSLQPPRCDRRDFTASAQNPSPAF